MSDNRSDPRFAMLALELGLEDESDPLAGVVLTEPAPTPRQLDVLRVDLDGSVACPRCGTGAFETTFSTTLNLVACRGCPPPAPTYELPNGISLKFNRYRCDACGKQTPVTMTLSEVNLYCGGCSRLAIHTRQEVAAKKLLGKKRSGVDVDREKRLDDLYASFSNASNFGSRRRLATRDFLPSVFVDEVNDILMPEDHPALVELTKTMMSILKLEDFDAYAARRRDENRASDDPRRNRDEERGTGRTWRGIVELLARHYLATTRPTVWVLGGSEREDDWLRNEVISIRNELGNDHPAKVGVVPDVERLVERKLKPPAGVMLFVDHTFYEGRKGFRSGIIYKPDF